MARTVPPVNRTPDYADLDLSFIRNPTTSDVYILEGESAIKRSVRNLIFTNFRERPFRPQVGSALRQMLFELDDPMVMGALKDIITSLIQNFEPRVSLLDVNLSIDNDRNGFNVELYFTILNKSQPLLTTVFLERIR